MSEKPKQRRFWQLHLSTAVILMIVAGALLGIASESGILTDDRILAPISFVVFLFMPTLYATAAICESIIRSRKDRKI